jgi:transcriptional regulator with XRE-family HTH domain
VDVAVLARVSHSTISRIERGQIDTLSLHVLRAVGRAVDVRLELAPWSRRGDLVRFATADHAELVEAVIAELRMLGWDARAEISFNEYGERGFIDILAWHASTRTLLVIEVKTEIVDVGEVLGTLDRKGRLAPSIARGLGWHATSVARALIVAEGRTNRRRVAAHAATFASALPSDGRTLRAYLRHPTGTLGAVSFWSRAHPGDDRQLRTAHRRVRRSAAALSVRESRSGAGR